MSDNHAERIRKELIEAGISKIGMLRFSTGYVHKVVRPDEHIMVAIYGHRDVEPGGIFGYEEGLLLATDQRVIYLVYRPGYSKTDEMSYESIEGVKTSYAGLFCGIQIHSMNSTSHNLKLSFVRKGPARRFAEYVGQRAMKKA